MKASSTSQLLQLPAAFLFTILMTACSDGTPQAPSGTTQESSRASQPAGGIPQQPSVVSQQAVAEADLLIESGRLLDMVGDEPNAVPIKGIVIRDGRIDRILAANSSENLPAAARTIDASSLYILPGLIDAHVHFRPFTPDAAIWRRGHLYYGITTLQDFSPCGSNCKFTDPNEWLLAYKDLVNNSPISNGPTLYIAGMKLNGPDAEHEAHAHNLAGPDAVVPYIDYLLGLGIDFITVEDELPPEYLKIALEEAAKRRVPIAGHSKDAKAAISLGQKFIEHMYSISYSMTDERKTENFISPDYDYLMDLNKAPEMIRYLLENGVYLNPTMTSRYGRLSHRAETFTREDEELFQLGGLYSDTPEEFRRGILAGYKMRDNVDETRLNQMREGFEKIQIFLRQFTEAGGMVLAGTDTTAGKMPGLTMHRELDMLVDAGITPYRALLGATRWPAQFLYKDDLIGTIEPGKQADILLLGSNPAEDIVNSRDIQYVVRKGTIQRSPGDCSVIEPPQSLTCW
jgi:imidazolonepropionase-like amidohydrolase